MRWPVQTFRRTTWKLVCCPCYFSPYCPYNTSSLVIGNCLYFLIEFICINLSERNLFTERWLLKFDGRDRAEQSRHRHAGRQQHQRPPWQWWNKPYCWTFWSWNRVLIARTRRGGWGRGDIEVTIQTFPIPNSFPWLVGREEDFCWYYGDCCCCFSCTFYLLVQSSQQHREGPARMRTMWNYKYIHFGHEDLFISSCKYSATGGWFEGAELWPTPSLLFYYSNNEMSLCHVRGHHRQKKEMCICIDWKRGGWADWPGDVHFALSVCKFRYSSLRLHNKFEFWKSYVALCRVHRELKRLLFSYILQHRQRALIWIITINEHT